MPLCSRPGCSKTYVPHREWQRFCSKRCRQADYEEKHPRVNMEKVVAIERALETLRRELTSRSTTPPVLPSAAVLPVLDDAPLLPGFAE